MSVRIRRRLLARPGHNEIRLEELLEARRVPAIPQFESCGYYIDFALPKEMIAIEVDSKHRYSSDGKLRKEKDIKRQVTLQAQGWKFIRVRNTKVEEVFPKLRALRASLIAPCAS